MNAEPGDDVTASVHMEMSALRISGRPRHPTGLSSMACPRSRGFNGRVFVHEETHLDLSFAAAQQVLADLARGSLLLNASRAAYGEGITGLARVGPVGTVRGLSRLVQVDLGDPTVRPDSARLALRWEATGPGSSLLPALDADIDLTPTEEGATKLTLNGVYRPPMGALGAGLDQAVLSRIATATIRDFVGRLAGAITDLAAGQDRSTRPPPAALRPQPPGCVVIHQADGRCRPH
jgi:hypothetical protein